MSFYPPGWDYNYLLNCREDEIMALGEEHHTTLFNGLREAGLFDKMMAEWERRDKEAQAAKGVSKVEEQKLADREIWAPYIHDLDLVFKENKVWSEWGFVIFRATAYGAEEDARWAEFRRRWDEIFEEEFEEHRGFHPKSDRAMKLMRFRWVEDPSLAGASAVEVSSRFNELWKDLPTGLATTACLMVTPSAMESVLDSPPKDPNQLPFVVAVARTMPSEEELDRPCNGHFNVAVESLLKKFYSVVALDVMDFPRLMGCMRHEKDIWCDVDEESIRYYEE